jgi:hypothetical protein
MKLLSAIAVLAFTLREAQRYNIYHVKETEPVEFICNCTTTAPQNSDCLVTSLGAGVTGFIVGNLLLAVSWCHSSRQHGQTERSGSRRRGGGVLSRADAR